MLRRTENQGKLRSSHGTRRNLGLEWLEERQLLSSLPLHVDGNRLVDSGDHEVILRGVNIISLEWRPDGDNVVQAVDLAIHDWHANLLRLPVNQDFWFGHNQFWTGEDSGDGGAAYRAIVDQVIQMAKDSGVYVMLDMHWSDMGVWGASNGQHFMPDDHTTQFWQDAAARYVNNPAVLFDPYNEPHFANDQPSDGEFATWRDGGQIHENGEFFGNYHSPGMQGLINTIRDTGANNIIAAEGLNWGSNLAGVLTGHALSDPAGNLMYQSHLYPNKLADNEVASSVESVSQSYPIYVGEWGVGGEIGKPNNAAAQSNQEMLSYLNAHPRFHWTAWAFTCSLDNEWNLLTDWNPNAVTSDYGAYVKASLATQVIPPAAAGNHVGFGPAQNSAVNADGPQLLAAGSFSSNIDSIPDLAVTNLDGSVSILLGHGDGSFEPGESLFVGSPEGVVAGDFNRDGADDLAVASNGGFVAIFIGGGDGQFSRVANLPDGPNGVVATYMTAADMDRDGVLDLVVADYSNPTVLVYRGLGDGSFEFHDYNYTANGVMNAEQVVVADFNGDGNPDIAVANKGDGSVSIFRGLGDGFITAAGNIQLPSFGSIGLAAGDLDGDGKVDLAIANYGNDSAAGGAHRLNILRNLSANGTIAFDAPSSIELGDHLLNVVIADFDEDGRSDIAVTSSGTTVDANAVKDNSVWLLYNEGHGAGDIRFSVPATPLRSGWNPVGLIAADLNGDSHLDLISADQDSDRVSAFLNEFESGPAPVDGGEKQATSTQLSVPPSITLGGTVQLIANVSAMRPGMTGTVTFRDGDTVLGSAQVVNGVAIYQTNALPIGVRNVSARYEGDGSFQASDWSDPRAIRVTGDVTNRFRIARGVVTIDPIAQRASQLITLTNISATAVPLPLTLAFRNLSAGSKRISVLGQTGVSGRTSFLAISNGASMLMPGESITIRVSFASKSNKVKYTLAVLYE